MSLTGKKFSSRFKDLLVIQNSNNGFDNSRDQIQSGNGNGSSLYLSTDQALVKGASNSTGSFFVQNATGNELFKVDSTNSQVKSLETHVNTQYATFSICNTDSSAFVAGTHYPIFFGGHQGFANADVDFGTGTDPGHDFTTSDTDSNYAAQIVPMMWIVPDNISIDSVSHIEGADAATGEVTRMHLKSFTYTSGSTSCLASGELLAHSNDITNAGNEQVYSGTWTFDSATVTAGKAILCFFKSDSTVNSDYSITCIVKYHLT